MVLERPPWKCISNASRMHHRCTSDVYHKRSDTLSKKRALQDGDTLNIIKARNCHRYPNLPNFRHVSKKLKTVNFLLLNRENSNNESRPHHTISCSPFIPALLPSSSLRSLLDPQTCAHSLIRSNYKSFYLN